MIRTMLTDRLKNAMKQKNKPEMNAIKQVYSQVKLRDKDGEVSEEGIRKLIQKQIKQRESTMKIYQKENRQDLYENESLEKDVLESLLK